MEENKQKSPTLYTRRDALKILSASAIGLAFSGTLLQSCASGSGAKKGAKSGVAPLMEAAAGTKIVSRNWPALGENIGLLGLGCMRLPSLPSDNPRNSQLDQEQINQMVDYSLEHGVNYFDTAPAYGQSEVAMGIALSRHPRESYLLATKMSNMAFGPGAEPTLDAAQQMFERSLSNLQTDYIDFFLLHNLSDDSAFMTRFINNGVLDYIVEQQAAGRIKHLGFSFHGSNSALKDILDLPYKWDFVQIQMNYVDWKDMPMRGASNAKCDSETLYNMLVERGIPVAVMEPIRGGALANISTGLQDMLAQRFPNLTPAGVALSFVGSFPGVMVTLSGMSNLEQLKENVATFTDFKSFNEADNEFLMKAARLYNSNVHISCTGCSYCMPCPNGVNIPGNFKVFNEASDSLMLPDVDGPHDADFKKTSKAFLKKYKSELGDGMRADACTNCNACIPKCPQHIRIPDQLKMINDLVSKL